MIQLSKKYFPAVIVMLLILIIGAKCMFNDSMNTYPAYVHAWTQSDRVALAQNFQLNGFDFFHPATYNLLTKDGITQVDFPIHDYLVAVISSVLNTEIIPTFRWYTLILSLIGIFYFFQTLLLFTKSSARAIFGASFIYTLPFLVFYENGFLPSAPSFSLFLVGIFYLFNYLRTKEKTLWISTLLLTLAALGRMPFVIFLIATLLFFIWNGIKSKKVNFKAIGSSLIGVLAVLGYFLYNQYLASTYGSMFLSELLHFTSFANFLEVMVAASDRWGNQLISPYHGILFILLMIALVYQTNKYGLKNRKSYELLLLTAISSVGVLLFFIAFGQQFADHDYYYIDSFLPIFSLLIVFGLSQINISKKWYTPIASVSFIFFFYFFSYATSNQKLRYTPPFDDRVEFAYNAYENSKTDLTNWGVQKSDTLFIIEPVSTNMAFNVFGNRGYTNLIGSPEILGSELDSSFQYAILLDSFFIQSCYKDYPGIINRLEKVNGNGTLSIFKKSSQNNPSLFFNNLIANHQTNFDGEGILPPSALEWLPIKTIDDNNGKSLYIENQNEYALTIRDTILKKLNDQPLHLQFVADYYRTDTTEIQVILSVGKYYGAHYTVNELDSIGSWEHKQFNFKVDPKYFEVGDELTFYLWNPEKNDLVVDNINLIIYQ